MKNNKAMSEQQFNVKKVGNYFVAFDKVDKKRSYGKIHINTGKFIGDTRCSLFLHEQQELYSFNNPNGKQNIIDRVIEQMKYDISIGDVTAIDELLHYVPIENMKGYLAEE